MSILGELGMDVTHLKSGWQGTTGSGKTTTAALVAIGLYKHLKLKTPVAFYDSERGSGFVHKLFTLSGIKLVGVRSRSFKDLAQFMRDCDGAVDIAIIDSVTHPWRELLEAYKARTNRNFIRIQDWGPIKEEWQEKFTLPYINSKMHILMCGRQANVFEDVADEDNKKAFKAVKTGTKMATEGETGYEPNILIEMEKVLHGEGGAYTRVATVLKDRSFQIDGATTTFNMPLKGGVANVELLLKANYPFQFLLPHISTLDVGGTHAGVAKPSSKDTFREDGSTEKSKNRQMAEIALANFTANMEKHWPGQEKIAKKARGDIIESVTAAWGWKTRSWTEVVETFQLDRCSKMVKTLEMACRADNIKRVNDALAEGSDEKGKIIDGHAASLALTALIRGWLGDDVPTEEPLPF